jgi:adenosine deaminase
MFQKIKAVIVNTGKDKINGAVKSEKVKERLTKYQKEFKKQMSTMITGAFAFVAALFWRDAIKSYVDHYEVLIKNLMPIKEAWFVQLVTALVVSIAAIIAIILINDFLKSD